jgi:arsenate reductase
VEVFSAGTEPSKVNPFAIQAMDQMNIDIRAHTSKDVGDFLNADIDYVITVCDRAKESCPIFPGAPEQIHWSFPDPAEVEGEEEEKAMAFYDTALQLNQRINHFIMVLGR